MDVFDKEEFIQRKNEKYLNSRPLKSIESLLLDVDMLIKRCGLVCRKVAICLQNLADFYVV